jgi:adenine phosphoribosyltransferase
MLLAYILTDYTVVPVRKKGKLPGDVISVTYDTEYSTDTLECSRIDLTGKGCWFVDDIYATGGTYRAVEDLVSQLGGNLLGGSVLLDVLGKKDAKIVEVFSNFS